MVSVESHAKWRVRAGFATASNDMCGVDGGFGLQRSHSSGAARASFGGGRIG